jgi:hypothetical protein
MLEYPALVKLLMDIKIAGGAFNAFVTVEKRMSPTPRRVTVE